MKIIRVGLSVLLLLALVLTLAGLAFIVFTDPNDLKPIIADEVKAQTGYEVAMNGRLSWSFYPHFGVKMDDAALLAPQSDEPFLKLQGINVGVDLPSLMRGEHVLKGDVAIANVELMKLHLQSVRAVLHFDHRELTINPFSAYLYNGTLTGVVSGRDFTTLPSWAWDVTLNHVDLKTLLSDVNGADAKLTLAGDGNVHFTGESSGKTGEALFNHMQGSGVYSLKNGEVQAIDLNYLLLTADALLNKQTITVPAQVNATNFDHLSGAFTVQNGILTTNNLELQAPTFVTKGDVSLQLTSRAISAHLNIDSTKALKTKFTVPVLITGDVMKPDVRLDMAAINQTIARQQIDRVKVKVQEKVKALSVKANDFFHKLIGH